MKNYQFFIILVLFYLFSGCNNETKKIISNYGLDTKLIISKDDANDYIFTINVYNNNDYNVGIIFIGEVRDKNYTGELGSLLTDTIIKVFLPNKTIASTDIEKKTTSLSNAIPRLIILKSKSSADLNIIYEGNLEKDFDILGKKVDVQVIIKPLGKQLEKSFGITKEEFIEKYPNVTLVEEDIISPKTELK